MATEHQDRIELTDSGVLVHNYRWPGDQREIPYSDITGVSVEPLGLMRFRLVGIGPMRLREYFHWDSGRRSKTNYVRLTTTRGMAKSLTPADPEEFSANLRERLSG